MPITQTIRSQLRKENKHSNCNCHVISLYFLQQLLVFLGRENDCNINSAWGTRAPFSFKRCGKPHCRPALFWSPFKRCHRWGCSESAARGMGNRCSLCISKKVTSTSKPLEMIKLSVASVKHLLLHIYWVLNSSNFGKKKICIGHVWVFVFNDC